MAGFAVKHVMSIMPDLLEIFSNEEAYKRDHHLMRGGVENSTNEFDQNDTKLVNSTTWRVLPFGCPL